MALGGWTLIAGEPSQRDLARRLLDLLSDSLKYHGDSGNAPTQLKRDCRGSYPAERCPATKGIGFKAVRGSDVRIYSMVIRVQDIKRWATDRFMDTGLGRCREPAPTAVDRIEEFPSQLSPVTTARGRLGGCAGDFPDAIGSAPAHHLSMDPIDSSAEIPTGLPDGNETGRDKKYVE